MSHVADVNCKFTDLSTLADAVREMGGELIEGQKTHAWFGQFLNDWSSDRAAVNRRDPSTFGKCDHAIKFKDARYEIGIWEEADGTYTAVYDSWGGEIEKIAGQGLTKLVDEYSAQASIRVAARKGFRVTRSTDVDGSILLMAVK